MRDDYRKHLMDGELAGSRYSLAVPREALRGAAGYWTGHAAGSSVDFKDYREYQPGDDLRAIDWNVYARSDKLIIKMFREEVNPHLDLVLDCSASMALDYTDKLRALLMTAGALAMAAMNARCSHKAWMIGDGIHAIPGGTGMPSLWDRLSFDHALPLPQAFDRSPARWRKNGLRVLVSDLLWPGDPMESLRILANGAAALFVVQLLAREDVAPSCTGNVRAVDAETNAAVEVFFDALAAKTYADVLERHQANWQRACRQVGARMTTMVAEPLAASASLDALEHIRLLEPA